MELFSISISLFSRRPCLGFHSYCILSESQACRHGCCELDLLTMSLRKLPRLYKPEIQTNIRYNTTCTTTS